MWKSDKTILPKLLLFAYIEKKTDVSQRAITFQKTLYDKVKVQYFLGNDLRGSTFCVVSRIK